MNFYRKCWFDPFEEQFISPFLSDCPSLMLGIAIHCIQCWRVGYVSLLTHSFIKKYFFPISNKLFVCISVTIQMELVIEDVVSVSSHKLPDIYSVKFPWSIFIAGISWMFGIISCVFYHLVLRSLLHVPRFSEYHQGTEEQPSDRFLISDTFLVRSSPIVRGHSEL